MVLIIFVRHGENKPYADMQVKYPGPGLTKKGVIQAKETAKYLKRVNIDEIYVSDMTRALETANEINKYHNKELIISRDIAEVNKIIFDKNPEDKDKLKTNIERAKKTINYFKKILNANKRCVLIVAHGNVIRVILGYFMNKNIKDSPYMSLGNCSISAVAIDKNKLSGLLFLGCTEHLKKKETIKEKFKRVFYN